MPPRIYVDLHLSADATVSLPESAAQHIRVLRLQPGDAVRLFRGDGFEWDARVTSIRARGVDVVLERPHAVRCELPMQVTIALVVPANDRMDTVVEKATELGATTLVPLLSARSVVRLDGDRAIKRCTHWQAVAIAAAEQCGRGIVPHVTPIQTLKAWLAQVASMETPHPPLRLLLSPRATASVATLYRAATVESGASVDSVTFLSGPEGGFESEEEDRALAAGFAPCSLGPRILRADTAPLAALATIAALCED